MILLYIQNNGCQHKSKNAFLNLKMCDNDHFLKSLAEATTAQNWWEIYLLANCKKCLENLQDFFEIRLIIETNIQIWLFFFWISIAIQAKMSPKRHIENVIYRISMSLFCLSYNLVYLYLCPSFDVSKIN